MPASPFLLVFVDGMGLGQAIAHNPLATPTTMPFLTELLGEPPLEGLTVERPGLCFKPIDATLGIPGLPQSATGQPTLYTGQNAAQFRGKHQSAFANGSLRQLIEPHGIFRQVIEQGRQATQANAYLPSYFEAIKQRRRRYAVGALLNLTCPLPFRDLADYCQGRAVYWDITGEIVERIHGSAAIAPSTAAQRLINLTQDYDLTLFETFLPDYAGHRQNWEQATLALQRIDALLEQLVVLRPKNLTLVLSSDHGNVEDLSSSHHSLNAVPLLAIGPGAAQLSGVMDLTGVTPSILRGISGII